MNSRVSNGGMTILAGTILVTTLMMTAPGLYASTSSEGFKIQTFGIDDDGNPFLTVNGQAGGKTPDKTGDIFAYVFFTDDGIYAVTSHPGVEDSKEVEDDEDWHAHKVKLDSNNCVTSLKEQGDALLDGDKVSVENTKATEVTKVLTALLVAEGDEVCVEEVFDSKG
ncbi:MAG TPA: hypothetical protein VFY55_02925 [Nitrososphaeraceae archaeon]|nr:hypothetical protein [Nitrososphaeraceae archaeon]